jgi:hypothetical protein
MQSLNNSGIVTYMDTLKDKAMSAAQHTPVDRSQYRDPRGPHRIITGIKETPSETVITTDCGHSYGRTSHFSYTMGARIPCFRCAKEGRYE